MAQAPKTTRNTVRLQTLMMSASRTGKLSWSVRELAEELDLARHQVRSILLAMEEVGGAQPLPSSSGRKEEWVLGEPFLIAARRYDAVLTDHIHELQNRLEHIRNS